MINLILNIKLIIFHINFSLKLNGVKPTSDVGFVCVF